ncbi:MAG: hypothetical protein KC493_16120 [Bacteriovoracaceae bacterium]|nr:hypothetical protein [Bacteriovoracaceae bacterium]
MKLKIITFVLFLFSLNTYAAGPGFDDVTQTDLDNISKEFAANFVHRPIAPASSLGAIFGFEVGLVAGLTDASKIGEITKRTDPTESDPLDKLIHAGVLGSVSVPFGITGEVILLPEQNLGDVDISNFSLGIKWTLDSILPIPFVDVAIRGHYSSGELSFSDTVDAVNTKVSLENTTTGVTLLASAGLMIIEPFVGVGYVTRESTLAATGAAQIFDTTFTTAKSSTVDGSSAQIIVGAQLNLLFMKVGAQYESVFDTSVTSAKLTFGF